MSKRLFLKPASPGLIVRHPRTHRILPEAGGWVPDDQFYRRRIAAGDAVHATPPKVVAPTATPVRTPAKEPQ